MAADWEEERFDVLLRFYLQLAKATGDGSKKRQAGEKPPWYADDSHEAAIFSHLNKWKHGEKMDKDSGAHPLVHLAWRALAIACRESGDVPHQAFEFVDTSAGSVYVEYVDTPGVTITTQYEAEGGGA